MFAVTMYRQLTDRQIWILKKSTFTRVFGSAGTAVAILIALILLYLAHHEKTGETFWSVAVPSVLTGVGTIFLAATTVWLAVRERYRDDYLRELQRQDLETQAEAAYEHQRAESHAAAERARRAQAEMVAVWIGAHPVDHRLERLGAVLTGGGTVQALIVKNQSSLPVWDLRVQLVGVNDQDAAFHSLFGPVVPPGDQVAWVLRAQEIEQRLPGGLDLGNVRARVRFVDAAGVDWERTSWGLLTQSASTV
jgi:hypothetical protein